MGRDPLAQARATSVPPAKAHLQSLCTWRSEGSPQTPKTADEIPVRPTLGRPTSDPGQPGQENRWHRWSKIRPTNRQICDGRSHSPKTDSREETTAAQTRLDTEARENGAKAIRHSRDDRQGMSGISQASP